MKTKFTLLTLSLFGLFSTIDAATAYCTCKNGRQPTVRDIGVGDDVKQICERECRNQGGLEKAEKR